MTRLLIDLDEIAKFTRAIFRYVSNGQTIAIRTYPDNSDTGSFGWSSPVSASNQMPPDSTTTVAGPSSFSSCSLAALGPRSHSTLNAGPSTKSCSRARQGSSSL
jgi:hypothetical protein